MLNGKSPRDEFDADGVGASSVAQSPPSVPTASAVPADVLERVAKQRADLAERYKQPEVITAGYPGTCRACNRRYQVGDDIAGAKGWVHLVCAVCAACGNWIGTDDIAAPDVTAGFHRACQASAAAA